MSPVFIPRGMFYKHPCILASQVHWDSFTRDIPDADIIVEDNAIVVEIDKEPRPTSGTSTLHGRAGGAERSVPADGGSFLHLR